MSKKQCVWILITSLLIAVNSYGAVTSVGEINVAEETQGVVPASSTVPLLVTLSIDRSLAEPGEEIKTIEIEFPPGFVMRSADFNGIMRDNTRIAARAVVFGNRLRVELAVDIRICRLLPAERYVVLAECICLGGKSADRRRRHIRNYL